MFSGIVEQMGTVESLTRCGDVYRLVIGECDFAPEVHIGASVAVNGACLTVVQREDRRLAFEIVPETLAKTNLGGLQPGEKVNLERSLRFGGTVDGHFVLGHVDGVGSIDQVRNSGSSREVRFTCPTDLSKWMIPKGSIAVDGVSLTLVDVEPGRFSVALIPHTLAVTTLGRKVVGDSVNIEADFFGKYIWRYMEMMDTSSLRKSRRTD